MDAGGRAAAGSEGVVAPGVYARRTVALIKIRDVTAGSIFSDPIMGRAGFRQDAVVARSRGRRAGAGHGIFTHDIGSAGEFNAVIKAVDRISGDLALFRHTDADIARRRAGVAFRERVVGDGVVLALEEDSSGRTQAGRSHAVVIEHASADGPADPEHAADRAFADLHSSRASNFDASAAAAQITFAAQGHVGDSDVGIAADCYAAATLQASAAVDSYVGDSIRDRHYIAIRGDVEFG